MVDEETRRKLRELGMGEMVEALDLQESDGISMAVAFDDRIWMMVDYAYEAKYISSVKRLAARAKLRFVYCQALADKIGVMISTLSAFCVPTAFPTSEICQA